MDAETWRSLERLFEAAAELDEEARRELLDRECAGRSELRELAESLLRHASDTSLLDEVVAGAAESALEEPAVRSGSRLGAYRLERVIGRGGMGTVWLATRADDAFEKRVAIKIGRGAAGVEFDRRLRRERQILAGLEHPNIGRLLDGGTTPAGAPYLVMEHVEGVEILEHCDRHALGVDDRLSLFCTVCDAVAHAHRRLVVHRDLKPANILISEEGVPKLLDFGIAKILSDDETGEPAITRTVDRLLTPHYASPEQLRGELVTTATDIYSLGLLLYELLVGRRPFAPSGTSLVAIEREILEREPRRPSTWFSGATRADPEAVATARRRGARPESLAAKLRGDLDNIVLRALAKDPARRYGTAEQLAEDVRRHLAGRPVTARPDSAAYRVEKFVRRHPLGTAAALAAVILLLGATVALALLSTRLARQRDRAVGAELEARQVARYLVHLFEVVDPGESRGNEITAREILDRSTETIEVQLEGQPRIQSSLLQTMGNVYRHLGLPEQAAALLQRAVSLRPASFLESEPDGATLLDDLGVALLDLHRLEEAHDALQRAYRTRLEHHQGPHAEVAESLNNLGLLLHEQGRFAEAEQHLRSALAMWRETLGERDPQVAVALRNLASTLEQQGRFAEAEAAHRTALALRRELLGNDHPLTLNSIDSLGGLLSRTGKLAEAEPLLREAVDLRRRVLGDQHPRYAISLNNLASLLHDQGRLAEAEPLYREALEVTRRNYGDHHYDVAIGMNNLASLLEDRGEWDQALDFYRKSLDVRLADLGAEHPATFRAVVNLGRALMRSGELVEGERLLRQALRDRERVLGPEHLDVATSLLLLSELERRRGRMATAEELAVRAAAIREAKLGSDHPFTAQAHVDLWGLRCERGASANEVLPPLRAARDHLAAALPAGSPGVARAELVLGSCFAALGRPGEARPLVEGAERTFRARFGPRGPQTIEAARRLAQLPAPSMASR